MSFYGWNIICAIFALFIYISFRWGVDSYLRVGKNSKTFIRKNKKGFLNYWLYKKINSELGLGRIYYLNIFLLVLTLLYCGTVFILGWIELLSLPIAICNAALCLAQIPAILFSDIYYNLEYHKEAFVVLAKNRPGRGFNSSFFTVFGACLLLAFAIYNFWLAI